MINLNKEIPKDDSAGVTWVVAYLTFFGLPQVDIVFKDWTLAKLASNNLGSILFWSNCVFVFNSIPAYLFLIVASYGNQGFILIEKNRISFWLDFKFSFSQQL